MPASRSSGAGPTSARRPAERRGTGLRGAIDDTATVARRGVSSWELRVRGTIGHSSGIFGPKAGAGAIYEAARILDAFRSEMARETYLTINPSLIVGGTEARRRPRRPEGGPSARPM